MKLLCIDPGPAKSAWLCWETITHSLGAFGIDKNEDLALTLRSILFTQSVRTVCIEFPQSYGPGISAGASIMHTCRWVGRFEEAAIRAGISPLKIKLYGRPTIKGQVGGRTDAEIRASLRMRYGEARKGEKLNGIKADLWAALAIAVAVEENPNLKVAEP